MPTIEELRLARAKAMAWATARQVYGDSPNLAAYTEDNWWKSLTSVARNGFLIEACAIESADAALGVMSVPVVPVVPVVADEDAATEILLLRAQVAALLRVKEAAEIWQACSKEFPHSPRAEAHAMIDLDAALTTYAAWETANAAK